jgi:large subunit ribosomal protein L5
MHQLLKKYQDEVRPGLKKDFGIKNDLQVPRLVKIVVNMGLNDAVGNKGIIDKAAKQLKIIVGQQPAVTKAKKAISAFKLRKGMPMGLKITLRGSRMLDFWEKLVKIVLPRQRDFKGISDKSFDSQGNLNLGFREQTIFPDLEYDQIDKVRGLEITIVTSTTKKEQAKRLLLDLGLPFKK